MSAFRRLQLKTKPAKAGTQNSFIQIAAGVLFLCEKTGFIQKPNAYGSKALVDVLFFITCQRVVLLWKPARSKGVKLFAITSCGLPHIFSFFSFAAAKKNITMNGGNKIRGKNMKPFLKWAGGKTQLLSEIEKNLPPLVLSDKFTYVEPFVGSGAVLFWMLRNFQNMERAIINDINSDLINTYKIIRSNPRELVLILKDYQNEFHQRQNDEEKKKDYYYQKRDSYNARKADNVTQAALFIFLNRTCFNGLYRVNRSNLFNVPMGSYKQPTICDEQNILAVSGAIQNVEILNGDFEKTILYANANTFFYLDPPYKPLSLTSSFNSYAENEFDDNEQIRLKDFCISIHKSGSKWMVSNSDIQHDDFFHTIYKGFNIKQVKAKRVINSKPEKRGELNELVITNYKCNELHLTEKKQKKLWKEQTQ